MLPHLTTHSGFWEAQAAFIFSGSMFISTVSKAFERSMANFAVWHFATQAGRAVLQPAVKTSGDN